MMKHHPCVAFRGLQVLAIAPACPPKIAATSTHVNPNPLTNTPGIHTCLARPPVT